MSTEDSFLRKIVEAPNDDTPRLVYADWLEPRGDPRNEFIRIQCKQAQLPETSIERPALTKREEELIEQYQHVWLSDDLFRLDTRYPIGYKFHRGFLYSVEIEPHDFLSVVVRKKLSNLVKRTPLLRRLQIISTLSFFEVDDVTDRLLDEFADDMQQALQKPEIGLVPELSLRDTNMIEEDLATIAANPASKKIAHLDLSFNPESAWDEQTLLVSLATLCQNFKTTDIRLCHVPSQTLLNLAEIFEGRHAPIKYPITWMEKILTERGVLFKPQWQESA